MRTLRDSCREKYHKLGAWDTGWDDENLDDPSTKQLHAEIAEFSKKEKAADENSKG